MTNLIVGGLMNKALYTQEFNPKKVEVHINNKPTGIDAPFGGFKQSGNGREWGEFGFEEFLEIKAVMGYASK